MREWIISVMNAWGYGGVVFLIAVENVFPPIPSEVILTFGGFMTTCTDMRLWWMIVAATVGSLIGAIILYGAGRLLGAARVMQMLDGRVGRLLHFRRADVEQSMEWFEARGASAVLLCRCVPIVRSLISIPAGMAKMPLIPFCLLTTLGSLIWNAALVSFGALAGNSWETIAGALGTYSDLVAVVLLAAVPFVTMWILHRKRKQKR